MFKSFVNCGILLMSLDLAWSSRDTGKTFRSLPAISNSLVNLGKMDISFHFNSRPFSDGEATNMKPEILSHSASPFFLPRQESLVQHTVEVERPFEPCPCSAFKDFKNPFLTSNPTEIIGKILKSNNLFSYNQEPVISTTCCDSHEHVQEDTVFFDFSPKNHVESAIPPALPPFPFILEHLLPKKDLSATPFNNKPKGIEIFFFPKNRDSFLDLTDMSSSANWSSPNYNKKIKKSEIQIVGDKELRNDFKTYKPFFPVFANIEGKKQRDKKEKPENKENKPVVKADGKQEDDVVTTGKSTPAPFTASSTNVFV